MVTVPSQLKRTRVSKDSLVLLIKYLLRYKSHMDEILQKRTLNPEPPRMLQIVILIFIPKLQPTQNESSARLLCWCVDVLMPCLFINCIFSISRHNKFWYESGRNCDISITSLLFDLDWWPFAVGNGTFLFTWFTFAFFYFQGRLGVHSRRTILSNIPSWKKVIIIMDDYRDKCVVWIYGFF